MEKNILFVDDSPEVIRSIQRFMRGAEAFDCDYAASVNEAREMVCIKDYDVVVSDMLMVDGNGLQLLSYLREHAPHVTRIILSGHASASLIMDSIERAGVFRYLVKPLQLDDVFLDTLTDGANQAKRLKCAGAEHWYTIDDVNAVLKHYCPTMTSRMDADVIRILDQERKAVEAGI